MQPSKRISTAFRTLVRLGFAILFGIVLKTQAQPPDTLWTRTFGPADRYEECMGMTPDNFDGVYVVNWSELAMNEDFRSYVRRIDGSGNLLWQREYPDFTVMDCASLGENVYAVGVNYEAGGQGFVVCLDSGGSEQWSQYIPDENGIFLRSIYVDTVLQTLLIGASLGSSTPSVNAPALLAYDTNGDSLWTQTYPDVFGDAIPVSAISRVGSQFILLAEAELANPPFLRGMRLLWVGEDGTLASDQRIEFEDVRVEIYSVSVMSNGEFFLGGFAFTNQQPNGHPIILKMHSDGERIWRRDFDYSDEYIYKNSVLGLADGGAVFMISLVIEGIDQVLIVRVDMDGDTLWTKELGYHDDISLLFSSDLASEANNLTICGTRWLITDSTFSKHTLVAKYDSIEIHSSVETSSPTVGSFALSAFPNPFNSTLSISLVVPLHQDVTIALYDLLGREVDVLQHGKLASTTLNYTAPPTLATGIYFLRASTATQTAMQKVVLLK